MKTMNSIVCAAVFSALSVNAVKHLWSTTVQPQLNSHKMLIDYLPCIKMQSALEPQIHTQDLGVSSALQE